MEPVAGGAKSRPFSLDATGSTCRIGDAPVGRNWRTRPVGAALARRRVAKEGARRSPIAAHADNFSPGGCAEGVKGHNKPRLCRHGINGGTALTCVSLFTILQPTRTQSISYALFFLTKKTTQTAS